VARVEEGRVLLDLRTVFEDEEPVMVKALLETSIQHSAVSTQPTR
jgi:hypothetical protein